MVKGSKQTDLMHILYVRIIIMYDTLDHFLLDSMVV